ncbi:hypothetical protein [Rhizobium cremeum]|uniref:hypothetical protein n=1 Tax=Rhizobium cremeum TaxID=2813827 RepID=UPI000DE46E89
MLARIFRFSFALLLLAALASCSIFQGRPITRPLVYYVREVTVMADAGVPLGVIRGVDRRVSAAIAATRPPAGAQRVAILVRIEEVGTGFGARRGIPNARFTATAVSLETGEPVAEGTFNVNGSTDAPGMAEESLAEEISARVRFAFSLVNPSLRKLVRPPRTMMTRLVSDPPEAVVPAMPEPPAAPPTATPGKSYPEDGASGTVTLGKGSARP